jgi:hypothetical protein
VRPVCGGQSSVRFARTPAGAPSTASNHPERCEPEWRLSKRRWTPYCAQSRYRRASWLPRNARSTPAVAQPSDGGFQRVGLKVAETPFHPWGFYTDLRGRGRDPYCAQSTQWMCCIPASSECETAIHCARRRATTEAGDGIGLLPRWRKNVGPRLYCAQSRWGANRSSWRWISTRGEERELVQGGSRTAPGRAFRTAHAQRYRDIIPSM